MLRDRPTPAISPSWPLPPVIRSDQLYEQISRSCTLTPADAKAFLSAPANVRFSHPSIHLYPAAPSLLHLLVYSSHSFSGGIIA